MLSFGGSWSYLIYMMMVVEMMTAHNGFFCGDQIAAKFG